MRTLYDNFERPDTPAGTIGNAQSGQAWGLTGTALANTRVLSGRLVIDAPGPGQAFYAYIENIGGTLRKQSSTFSFTGSGAGTAMALISSSEAVGTIPANWNNVIHTYVYQNGWAVEIYDRGLVTVTLASGLFATPLANDGTVYSFSIERDPNDYKTLIAHLPTKDSAADTTEIRVTDARFASRWGKHVLYEVSQTDALSRGRYESVEVDAEVPGRVALPSESFYSDIERDMIDNEPPGLLPGDQSSLWGQFRKVTADWLQANALDVFEAWYANLDPRTVNEADLPEWEYRAGLPFSPNLSVMARRAAIQNRLVYGALSRKHINTIIETYLAATFNVSTELTLAGLVFNSSGIAMYAGATGDLKTMYRVNFDYRNWTLYVRVLSTVGVDMNGLTRELSLITPAGWTLNISSVANPLYFTRFVIDKQPVGYWKFDGNANDSSGYGNNGTFTGAPVSSASLINTAADNGAGGSYDFNGTSQYMAATAGAALTNPTLQRTIAATIRPDTLPGAGAYGVITMASFTEGFLALFSNAGQLNFTLSIGGVTRAVVAPAGTIAPATVYRVVGTFDGQYLRLFVNGVQVAVNGPFTGKVQMPSTARYFGGFGASSMFDGKLDEIYDLDRALTPDEVLRDYKTTQNIP